jgi:hypothetical protein
MSAASEAGADAGLVNGTYRQTSRVLIRSQQVRKLCLLQNETFGETAAGDGK